MAVGVRPESGMVGVRPESGTGILLSAKERREVLVQIRVGEGLSRRNGKGEQTNSDG